MGGRWGRRVVAPSWNTAAEQQAEEDYRSQNPDKDLNAKYASQHELYIGELEEGFETRSLPSIIRHAYAADLCWREGMLRGGA